MKRALYGKLFAAALVLAISSVAYTQDTAPRFDAASIKRNTSADPEVVLAGPQPGGYRLVNGSMRVLINFAWPAQSRTIVGLPDWAEQERYDVEAKSAAAVPFSQSVDMMRALLHERLAFSAHYETRDEPVYALTTARADGRLGPRLRPYPGDCLASIAALVTDRAPVPPPTPLSGATPCRVRVTSGSIVSGGVTLEALARALAAPSGRLVLDRTGLAGYYDFALEYSPAPLLGDGSLAERGSIFTALQEQLGLKLQPITAPLRTLVVDHIERPTEN